MTCMQLFFLSVFVEWHVVGHLTDTAWQGVEFEARPDFLFRQFYSSMVLAYLCGLFVHTLASKVPYFLLKEG